MAGHQRARRQARRPKVPKLACPQLAGQVSSWLAGWWSPAQIARRLRIEFPGDPMMQVSHETIYQSLYVQGRSGLRRELARCLRTGRGLTFSASGQLRSTDDSTGRGITLGYTGSQVTSLTDAAGQKVTLAYTSATLPDSQFIGYAYTGGRLTSVTTPGGASGEKTTYAYNGAGLLASLRCAAGGGGPRSQLTRR